MRIYECLRVFAILCISTAGFAQSPVQITTTFLPNGTKGQAYFASISASGGTGQYVGLTATGLPSGVAAQTGCCTISGTPTVAGTFTVTVTITDSAGAQGSKNLSLTVVDLTPTLSAINPAGGNRGTTVSPVTLTGTNFVSPCTVSVANAGVTPGACTVNSSTQIVTSFNISSSATPGAANVTVQTSNGTSNAVAFNIASPTLTPSPSALSFGTYTIGGTVPAAQGISVTSASPASGLSFTASLGADCAWLSLSPSSGITTANLSASVNTGGATVGSHSCVITFSASGVSPSPTVTATLTVSAQTSIAVSAPFQTFYYHIGGSQPPALSVSVTSTSPSSGVNVTASLGTGCFWLNFSPSTLATPASFSSQIGTVETSPGSYPCTITFSAPGATSRTLSVLMNIYSQVGVSCSPSTGPAQVGVNYQTTCTGSGGLPPYNWTISGTLPAGLTPPASTGNPVTITGSPTSPASYSYSVTVADSAVFPQTASAPFSGTIAPARPTLSAINPSSAAQPSGSINVPVTLTGTNFASPCTVAVANAGITPSGCTVNSTTQISATFTIQNSAALGAANVTVTTPGGTSGAVSFTVNAPIPPTLTVSPTTLPFGTYTIGGAVPASRSISVSSTNPSSGLFFNVSSGTDCAWLTLTVGSEPSTPVNLPASVNAAAATVGTHTCVITFSASGVSPSPTVTATLTVASLPTLSAAPASLDFGTYQTGGTVPASKSIAVSSTNPSSGLAFTVTPGSDCAWLTVTGTLPTPATLTASVNTGAAAVGNHNCTLTLNASGVTAPATVTATLVVTTAPPTLSAAPGSLDFGTYQSGGTLPAPKSISVSSTNPSLGLVFTISPGTDCGWLTVTGTLSTPGNLTASVNPAGATVGNHNCTLTFNASGVSAAPAVSATLAVTPGPTLSATPGNLDFGTFLSGSAAPASKSITVSSTNPSSGLAFTISPGNDCGWLTVTGTLSTPGNLTASLNPAGATPGNHSCTLTFNASGVSTAPTVTATLIVTSSGFNVTCNPTTGPTQVGVAYTSVCTASGGTPPYNWSIGSGALPAGVSLGSTAGSTVTISGSPTSQGPYIYSLSVTDSTSPAPQSKQIPFGGIISGPITLNCSPAAGPTQVGLSYSSTCVAAGGLAPYNWSVTGGSLPAGLTLSGTIGNSVTVSGTPAPAAQGGYAYTITVTDNAAPAQSASRSFSGSLATLSLLTLSCNATSGPTVAGAAYSATCTVTGGAPPYNWSITDGALPGGLTLSATTGSSVTISGNPTQGSYNYTVTVRDATTPTAQTAKTPPFSGAVLNLTTLSLACTPTSGPSEIGTPYSVGCTASGGTLPYGWSVSGTLPAGLSLSATTGASVTIGGTPTVAGNYNYTIRLTDSGTPTPATASQPYSGAIRSTFSVSPAALTFTHQPGAVVPPQQVAVSSTASGVAFTVAPGADCSGSGISATPAGGTTPGSITVSANPAALNPGTYNCTIAVNGGGAAQNVFVTFIVGGSIRVSPSTLSFSFLTGGQSPVAQTVAVSTDNANASMPFTASPGCSWVTVSPTSGAAPGSLSVSVNPAGLAQNTFTCPVTVSGPGVANSQQVTVTLAVSSPPTVTPASLLFAAKQGTSTPVVKTIVINGPDTPVSFTATISTASGGNWLSIGTTSGSTPANITVQADPAKLNSGTLGTFQGTVQVTFAGGQQPVNVSIALSVSPVTISVVPNPIQFQCQQGGTLPVPQILSVISSDNAPMTFASIATGPVTVTRVAGSQNLTVTPAANACLTPGNTSAGITVNTPTGTPATQTVPVTISVDPAAVKTAVLNVSQTGLTYSFVQGAAAETQTLSLSNQGGGVLNVTASASTASGGGWLSVVCNQTALTGPAPVPCTVTADPSKVTPNAAGGVAGTYSGEIDIAADVAGQSARVPVTMTLSALPNVLISRSGLSFSVVQGGTNPPADTVDILNGSLGTLTWTAQATTGSGGNWLKVNGTVQAATGSATAANPAILTVSVDATAGMAPGPYYGSVVISATDAGSGRPAANSPRTVPVVLNVSGSGSYLSPIVRPSGLIISGDAGAAGVPGQNVTVYNLGSTPVSYSSAVVTDDGGAWCAPAPANGSVSQNSPVSVQVDFSKLAAGVHTCNLRLLFGDQSLQNISVLAVATAPGGGTGSGSAPPRAEQALAARDTPADGNCNPANLPWTVNLTSPAQGGTIFAYQSADLEVKVVDGCRTPFDGANVSVNFSNFDAHQILKPTGGGSGIYRGSWSPNNVPANLAQTSVLLQAVATPQIGQNYKQGGSTPNIAVTVAQQVKNPTLISKIVNSASYSPSGRVSPCGWVSIFGQNLADSQVLATKVPLSANLGNASTALGGTALPLVYVDNGQINAQIPCGLNANTQLDLQVVHGDVRSPTEPVVTSDTQPALFTVNQQGVGQAAIFWTTPNGNYVPADANNPVSAGDIVEIYCTGLGPVSPPVTEGTVAPTPPATTTQVPGVTIGGLPARVTFAGLTPGAVGLYQVNVVVPANVGKGNAVPIVVTMDPQASQAGVTIAVK